MSFLPWTRSKSARTQSSTFAEALVRLAADPRIHQLFRWFSSHEREIADFQLAITAVAAPSFAEHARAAWFAERLQLLGLAVSIDAVGNLLARHPSASPAAPAIAISAHLDTVFPASTPLHVRRDQARLLGPGISDNGSGLAAIWALASAFHATNLVTGAPLLFIANVGEEGEGDLRGIRHLYRDRQFTSDASAPSASGTSRGSAPNSDPTPPPDLAMLIALDGAGNDNIISQGLGSRRFEIVITGPGGHSWSDHGVPNPIVAAAFLVATLHSIPLPANPRTTLNIGSIEGGTSINTIPDRVVLKVDLRSSDSRRIDELEQQLRRALADACAQTQSHLPHAQRRLDSSVNMVGQRPAGELADDSPLLSAIQAVDSHLGIQAQLLRASTDANIPLSLGLDAVSLGAGGSGGGAHTLHEWYDPAGRDLALKRLSLLILLLAGLPDPGADPSQESAS